MRVVGRFRHPRMHLDPAEALLLEQLLAALAAIVAEDDAEDAEVLARLYPAAYPDDEPATAEFRSLTENSLRSDREERIAACREQLSDPTGGVDIDLADPDLARRWLQVLNDLRLVHGTRLGITEDDDHEVDPTDPAQVPTLVYVWLTEVQDVLVRAVMS